MTLGSWKTWYESACTDSDSGWLDVTRQSAGDPLEEPAGSCLTGAFVKGD